MFPVFFAGNLCPRSQRGFSLVFQCFEDARYIEIFFSREFQFRSKRAVLQATSRKTDAVSREGLLCSSWSLAARWEPGLPFFETAGESGHPVAFIWYGVHLVPVNLPLFSRVPTSCLTVFAHSPPPVFVEKWAPRVTYTAIVANAIPLFYTDFWSQAVKVHFFFLRLFFTFCIFCFTYLSNIL